MAYRLTNEDIDALKSYAADNGRNWKSRLNEDWMYARVNDDRGVILHRLRNTLGLSWLAHYRLP